MFLDGVARGGPRRGGGRDLLGAEFLLALALGFDAALGRFDAVRAGPRLLIEHVSLAVRRRGLGVVVLAEALVGASALSVHLCPGVVQLGPSTLDVRHSAVGAQSRERAVGRSHLSAYSGRSSEQRNRQPHATGDLAGDRCSAISRRCQRYLGSPLAKQPCSKNG